MAAPKLIKVKDEEAFDLDYKQQHYVQQCRQIAVLSLPRLQALYLKYFQEDASRCVEPKILVYKLQYLLQRKWFKYHGRLPSPQLQRRTREVMALSINPEDHTGESVIIPGGTMAKTQTQPAPKTITKAPKPAPVAVVEEEDDEPTEDLNLSEEETTEDEDGDEVQVPTAPAAKAPKAQAAQPTTEAPAKRAAPARTGVEVAVKLKGKVFKCKYIYQYLVAMFAINNVLKATDEEIMNSIKTAWPTVNYAIYRVNADRKKYNAGAFKQVQSAPPEKKAKEWDAAGNKVVREVPPHLAAQVQKMREGKIKRTAAAPAAAEVSEEDES